MKLRQVLTLLWLFTFCVLGMPRIVMSVDSWPEFRGPYGNGQAPGSKPVVEWSESKNVAWKTAIHGLGWSSPVVWENQIWLTTATEDGKKMFAVCLDRESGKVVHDLLIFENEEPRFKHATNSYASPTPRIEAGRVYVHFGSYGTAAINTSSGKVEWQRRDFECNHWRGPGASLVLDGNKLLVSFDGYDFQFVVALDKRTGDTLWKKDRNIKYDSDDGDHRKAYSTGLLLKLNGRKQFISPSAAETISYDPDNGDEIWRVRHGGMNACARPVFGNGLVYLAVGDAGPTIYTVKPDGNGNVSETHADWSMARGGPKRPSLILVDKLLVMVTDDGIARCVDAVTGDEIWNKRLGGSFRSSPILANGNIYCFDQDGKSYVFKASAEFELVAENELDNGCQASPAVVGDTLFIRTTKHLYCVAKDE